MHILIFNVSVSVLFLHPQVKDHLFNPQAGRLFLPPFCAEMYISDPFLYFFFIISS